MQIIEGAVIACAGLGSRLGMGMPKCMIEVGGEILLTRLIKTLQPLVPSIYIVVGYREELIIDYCAQHHRDVIIVRNPEYRNTNTAHSMMLGSIGMKNKVLYLDGDLIIEPSSLKGFIEEANRQPLLVGVTCAKSSQAVFVVTEKNTDFSSNTVVAFQRNPETKLEWANVFSSAPSLLSAGDSFVFECIEPSLPAQLHELNLHEIDTAEDLEQAKVWLENTEM